MKREREKLNITRLTLIFDVIRSTSQKIFGLVSARSAKVMNTVSGTSPDRRAHASLSLCLGVGVQDVSNRFAALFAGSSKRQQQLHLALGSPHAVSSYMDVKFSISELKAGLKKCTRG